ncbi:MAG: hypothetical protein M3209_17925 [Acidobacteriota bacterium]|nr:hypothetical protein [Acidobacteriota bacterium]
MKVRKSFFIRWLMTFDQNKKVHSVIDIEHVQTGDTWRSSSLEETYEWMKNVCSLPDTEPKTDEVQDTHW